MADAGSDVPPVQPTRCVQHQPSNISDTSTANGNPPAEPPQEAGPMFEEPLDVTNLNNLDYIEAVALGCPVPEHAMDNMPSPTSTSFSPADSSIDLEKGQLQVQRTLVVPQATVSCVTLVGKNEHDNSPRSSTTNEEKEVEPAVERRASKALVPVPPKKYLPWWRRLRHQIFSCYRRLFSIVLILNIIALVVVTVLNKDKHPFGPSLKDVSTAVAANITATILIRQEYIINSLYGALCLIPLWMPLRIRRVAAKLYHFGGIHSGAAISSLLWFVLYTVLVTLQFARGELRQPAILVLTYLLVVLFIAICVLAHPRFRGLFHNAFEAVHRFGGWLAVALFWVLSILSCHAESLAPGSDPMGKVVLKSPSFWLLLLVTFCIILPWLRLQKVPVHAERLSEHAVRLHFTYLKHARPVFGIRIATSPLSEWHSFANIPSANKQAFTCVISAAGDWTREQIANPKPAYWVRGIPVRGVLRMSVIFRKVVVVCTGSGIGPVLSLTNGTGRCPQLRILWSTPNPLQTFGQGLIDETKTADPNVVIWNTREKGRPDVIGLTYQMFAESGAEAVFVISNPALTRKVVYAMESRGIPAYGPIWDS